MFKVFQRATTPAAPANETAPAVSQTVSASVNSTAAKVGNAVKKAFVSLVSAFVNASNSLRKFVWAVITAPIALVQLIQARRNKASEEKPAEPASTVNPEQSPVPEKKPESEQPSATTPTDDESDAPHLNAIFDGKYDALVAEETLVSEQPSATTPRDDGSDAPNLGTIFNEPEAKDELHAQVTVVTRPQLAPPEEDTIIEGDFVDPSHLTEEQLSYAYPSETKPATASYTGLAKTVAKSVLAGLGLLAAACFSYQKAASWSTQRFDNLTMSSNFHFYG